MSWIHNQHQYVWVSEGWWLYFKNTGKPCDLISRGHFLHYIQGLKQEEWLFWLKNLFIHAWKLRTNYQSLHLLLSSAAAKDLTRSLCGLSHFCLFTISSVSMFVCMAQLKNLVIFFFFVYFASVEIGANGISYTEQSFKNRPKQCRVLDSVHRGHLQAAAHQELRQSWSRGMMAEQCGAGPRINRLFNWTTFIKASTDAAQFFFVSFCIQPVPNVGSFSQWCMKW